MMLDHILKAKANIVTNHKVTSKYYKYIIDTFADKLHYRFTTSLLILSSVLVTSLTLIGKKIHCIGDDSVSAVLETYCFISSTYTVAKHNNQSLVDGGDIPYLGVGPHSTDSDEVVIHHVYYQWIPFILFGQALMFYAPHSLWKIFEGKLMRNISAKLKFAHFSHCDNDVANVKTGRGGAQVTISSKSNMEKTIKTLTTIIKEHKPLHFRWSLWFLVCELLYFVNLILQIYFNELLLKGKFLDLGVRIVENEDGIDVLDEVFPKMAKCHFHKYGPSGSIQTHDTLCVMTFNMINEKVYIFLWFWYIILFFVTVLNVIFFLTAWILHHRSNIFNKIVFGSLDMNKNKQLNPWKTLNITKRTSFGDWVFMFFLKQNVSYDIFQKCMLAYADQLSEDKILL